MFGNLKGPQCHLRKGLRVLSTNPNPYPAILPVINSLESQRDFELDINVSCTHSAAPFFQWVENVLKHKEK